MITLRRSKERHYGLRRKQEVWQTFYTENRTDPLADGFGTLESLNENRIPPGAGIPRHPHREAQIVTYVHKGALAQEDSTGRSGVIYAGEFQRMAAGNGVRHTERNASQADWAHVFQIRLRPSKPGLNQNLEQKRFSAAERRGELCVVASPDGRKGSLCIQQDALIYSAILDPGKHLVHQLSPGRIAWLHVVRGEATLGDLVLATGDGAGVTAEPAVSFTATEDTEILLFDLNHQAESSMN
jgi:redox-sensitive bicupin YhaK (pirin superfamily)